jgi:hypothetical protein
MGHPFRVAVAPQQGERSRHRDAGGVIGCSDCDMKTTILVVYGGDDDDDDDGDDDDDDDVLC